MNALLAFLSREWSGLVIAVVVAGAGLATLRLGRLRTSRWVTASGWVVVGISALLAAGAAYHMVYAARVRAAHPPPGQIVDVGGYRMHVLAEGPSGDGPAVVWLPGAHGAGFALYHLHAELRGEARSILVDRPGSGWSDPGPFPRTTPREVEEVLRALRAAGENGPYVFAGHSFGGLLAANIARRHPELTAAVVLLDATPPDAINYCPPNPFIEEMFRQATFGTLQRAFGIHADLAKRLSRHEEPPEFQRVVALVQARLGEAGEVLQRIEDTPRVMAANRSIFEELRRGGLGWEETVYDRDLEDQRVYLVAPPRMAEHRTVTEGILGKAGDAAQEREARRLIRFYEATRERYMQISSRAVRVYAPDGSGHNFPYEHPGFVIETMRGVLADVAAHDRR